MTTTTTRVPQLLPAATHSYLLRSADSLAESVEACDPASRYVFAHISALRSTAAVLAARAPVKAPRRRERNAWVLLEQAAPELAAWARFFSAGAPKRAAAEAGSLRAVTPEEAAELLREADRFLGVVEELLGLVPHAPSAELLAACGAGVRAVVA